MKAGAFADFRKMNKQQYRSTIRFLFLELKSLNEIKELLNIAYGDSSPSITTIKNWFNVFERGLTLVFDEPRLVAAKACTTEDNVIKIHDLVLIDYQLTMCEIDKIVGI